MSSLSIQNYPAVITKSRKFVYFNDSDLLAWSENNETRFHELAEHAARSGYKTWQLVSLGDITPMASRNLNQLRYEQNAFFLGM